MYNFRTDLALERRDLYKKAHNIEHEIDGIETEEEKVNLKENTKENVIVSRVRITNKSGEEAISKPIGNYITIDIKNFKGIIQEEIQKVSEIVTKELKQIQRSGTFPGEAHPRGCALSRGARWGLTA